MKLPEDFILHDGTNRPQCWIRNELDDMAYIHQERYTAADLKRLAEWCLNAAQYLECQQSVTKTPKKARSAGK